MDLLNDEEQLMLATVRRFLEREVAPVASELEHRNEYPTEIVERMKELNLFGANVPEAYGGLALSYTVFAMIFEEISRVWMGLAGILGTHTVLCDVLARFGTEEQKQKYLPVMARAEKRGPGLTISRDIDKLGYKSLETCEVLFEDFRVPAANLIGGREGEGFKQVMTGLEAERLNVAARGLGVARAAFEEAIRYAQQ